MQQRPASRAVPWAAGLAAAVSAAAFGVNERAQIIESIGGDEPGRDQLPQPGFDFRFQFSCAPNNVCKERSSVLLQKSEDFARDGAEAAAIFFGGALRQHPLRVFADEKCNR